MLSICTVQYNFQQQVYIIQSIISTYSLSSRGVWKLSKHSAWRAILQRMHGYSIGQLALLANLHLGLLWAGGGCYRTSQSPEQLSWVGLLQFSPQQPQGPASPLPHAGWWSAPLALYAWRQWSPPFVWWTLAAESLCTYSILLVTSEKVRPYLGDWLRRTSFVCTV